MVMLIFSFNGFKILTSKKEYHKIRNNIDKYDKVGYNTTKIQRRREQIMLKKFLLLVMVGILCLSVIGCGDTTTMQGEIKEDAVTEEEQKESFDEVVFVDDENCMFKISDAEEDDIWGYVLKAEMENKTDKNLMFSFNDVSVNGFMCDPFWATSVQAGKKAKSDISFSTDSFEELGIEKVENIEFTLSVYDEDDWMAEHLVEEVFTLTISE